MSSTPIRKLLLAGGVLGMSALLVAAAPAKLEEGEPSTDEANAPAAGVEAEAKNQERQRSRRPVLAPGQEAPEAAPPPLMDLPVSATRTETVEEPTEPPPPLEFMGAPVVEIAEEVEEEAAISEAPLSNPGEVRYTIRRGNYHYTLSVRPGIPQPGEPVELSWRIVEQLLIPDPYLGDRKPLAGVELVAKISGPEPERLYLVHEGSGPGLFGHHFTPTKAGAYKVTLDRRDGRRGLEMEMVVPVGAPPLPATRELKVDLLPAPSLDPSSVSSLMRELGTRWMELERKAGTPDAAEAQEKLEKFAADLRDGGPAKMQKGLAGLASAIQSIPAAGNRDATLARMDEVNFSTCLRCHAAGRLEFAKDVSNWPSFTPNTELKPPSAKEPTRPARRGPVAPGSAR